MTRHPAPRDYEMLHELPEDRRFERLRHAETCRKCREVLAAQDPTAIFSLLALKTIPEMSLARLTRDIDAAIDAAPRAPGWRGAAAALAASLLLAAFFGFQAIQDDSIQIAQEVRELGSRVDPDSIATPPFHPDPLLPVGSVPERGLELISSPGNAEVVDFALGETQVVMIFDSALDI